MIQIDVQMPSSCYDCWIRKNLDCRIAYYNGWLNNKRADGCPLKAQEPRVMTLEEVFALNSDTPIFIQYKSGENGWDIFRGVENDITHDIITGAKWAEGNYLDSRKYGKDWLCWTFRPTDEQREATPWAD